MQPKYETTAYGHFVCDSCQSLFGDVFRHPTDFIQDRAGLYLGDPIVGFTLAFSHSGFGGLDRQGLVGKNGDPEFSAAPAGSGNSDACGLDLAVGDPAAFEGLESILSEREFGASPCLASALAFLDFSMFDFFGH